jgi:hypothetical protein
VRTDRKTLSKHTSRPAAAKLTWTLHLVDIPIWVVVVVVVVVVISNKRRPTSNSSIISSSSRRKRSSNRREFQRVQIHTPSIHHTFTPPRAISNFFPTIKGFHNNRFLLHSQQKKKKKKVTPFLFFPFETLSLFLSPNS